MAAKGGEKQLERNPVYISDFAFVLDGRGEKSPSSPFQDVEAMV